MEGVPSLIKDSTDAFLQWTIYVTFHHTSSTAILFASIYPLIPNMEGLEALRLAMSKTEGDMPVDERLSLTRQICF